MNFIEVKSLSGSSYVRARDVLAVQMLDQKRCSLVMSGGAAISCNEPAAEVVARIEAALGKDADPKT